MLGPTHKATLESLKHQQFMHKLYAKPLGNTGLFEIYEAFVLVPGAL